jgi:hypothetical protein
MPHVANMLSVFHLCIETLKMSGDHDDNDNRLVCFRCFTQSIKCRYSTIQLAHPFHFTNHFMSLYRQEQFKQMGCAPL